MVTKTKSALIREPGVPIGTAAPMYLMCECGNQVYVPLMFTNEQTCSCDTCGQKYDRQGWKVN